MLHELCNKKVLQHLAFLIHVSINFTEQKYLKHVEILGSYILDQT
jgi:hypothetical protein